MSLSWYIILCRKSFLLQVWKNFLCHFLDWFQCCYWMMPPSFLFFVVVSCSGRFHLSRECVLFLVLVLGTKWTFAICNFILLPLWKLFLALFLWKCSLFPLCFRKYCCFEIFSNLCTNSLIRLTVLSYGYFFIFFSTFWRQSLPSSSMLFTPF